MLVHAAMKQVNLEIPPGLSDLLFGSWSAISHSAYEALREVIDTVSAVQHGSAKLARFGTDPRSRAQGAMYSLLAALAAVLAAARYVGHDTTELALVVDRRTVQVAALLVLP